MASTTYTGEELNYSTTVVDRGTRPRILQQSLVDGRVYIMKATDTGLGRVVYWQSLGVDTNGSQYRGTGPLTDITYVLKGNL